VNIRMQASQSFCVEALANQAGVSTETNFLIDTVQPSLGSGRTGALFGRANSSHVGQDGVLRICDLARGEYRLMVMPGGTNTPSSLGVATFAISDEDLTNLQVSIRPRIPLPGKVSWITQPPSAPIAQELTIALWNSNYASGGPISTQSTIPGEYQIKWNLSFGSDPVDPLMEQYRVDVRQLPPSVYVKDVTYGGESVWHKPLHLGSKPAGVGLEVILAHDGGTLHARATDDKGEPASDVTVV